jgi:hypothetical protein
MDQAGISMLCIHAVRRARQSESTVMFNLQGAGQQKNRESVGGEGDLMFRDHYVRIPNCHRKSRTGLELERNQRERDVKIVITLDHEVHIYDQFI